MKPLEKKPCNGPRRHSAFALAVSIVLVLLVGCAKHSLQNGSEAVNADSVQEIVVALEGMPNWRGFSLNKDYPEERALIEATVRRIARYDLDTVREAIEAYESRREEPFGREGPGTVAGKLLILNKFLFDLPETVRADSGHFLFFGGHWVGLPVTGGTDASEGSGLMYIRWPWSADSDGTWRLTGDFGGFFGPPYRPLDAFDHYRKAFGKRVIDK